ncbi:hypothetical protein GCM10011363_36140 [Marivita lacus]|uniref:Uncharacterized protein n=1 Tax=Marivita lacus TaxID=1323742 RepID=A0ABQ1L345_9RHOB|nr:hypothetical protein GCM10011363_36140 [Marivita lacus]
MTLKVTDGYQTDREPPAGNDLVGDQVILDVVSLEAFLDALKNATPRHDNNVIPIRTLPPTR